MWLIRFLTYLAIISIALGQFGVIRLFEQQVNLYATEVLLAIIGVVFLLLSLGVKKKLKLPEFSGWILAFLGIAMISLVNSFRWVEATELLVSSLYLFRLVLYVLLYVIAYNLFSSYEEDERKRILIRFIYTLVGIGVLLSIFGYIQLVIFPDFTALDPMLGWDPHQNRLASTFFDPNFMGAYLVLTLILQFSLLSFKVKGISRNLLVLSTAIVFPAFVLTFSRSAYLMFSVATLAFGIFKSRKLLVLGLFAFLIAFLLIPRVQTRIMGGVDPDDSARMRFASWQKTIGVIERYPLLGTGYNTYRYAQERLGYFDYTDPFGGRSGAGADSSLLFVWATTGILGLVFFFLFFVNVAVKSLRTSLKSHGPPLKQALNLAVFVSLLALALESNFINSLFYPWIMLWLWLMIGLSSVFNHED